MNIKLSKYKFRKLAKESLKNVLRLHFDSIILFNNESYPSGFHLSVLALEEFAKAKMVDHYYYSSITNEGFPDTEFEQDWLKLLYYHPKKQFAYIAREIFDYSPNFVNFIKKQKLELKKQQSIYVGLNKKDGKIDTTSRISIPIKKIKREDTKQMISLINQELCEIYEIISTSDNYWGIENLNEVITDIHYDKLRKWKYKTKLKKKRFKM
jgi:AbiV family abortive infection protein